MRTETYTWYWDEAFSKYGFDDGDGPTHNWEVISFIEANTEYRVTNQAFSIHKYRITEIQDKNGNEIECDGVTPPGEYLPEDLMKALNEECGPAGFL